VRAAAPTGPPLVTETNKNDAADDAADADADAADADADDDADDADDG
jgi:hypothetical protein